MVSMSQRLEVTPQDLAITAAGITGFYGIKDIMPKGWRRGAARVAALGLAIAPLVLRSRIQEIEEAKASCLGENPSALNPHCVADARRQVADALATPPALVAIDPATDGEVPGQDGHARTAVPSQATMLRFYALNEQRIRVGASNPETFTAEDLPGELVVRAVQRVETMFGEYTPDAPAIGNPIPGKNRHGLNTLPVPDSSVFGLASGKEMPEPASMTPNALGKLLAAEAGDGATSGTWRERLMTPKVVVLAMATALVGVGILQVKIDDAIPKWLGKKGLPLPNTVYGAVNALAGVVTVAADGDGVGLRRGQLRRG